MTDENLEVLPIDCPKCGTTAFARMGTAPNPSKTASKVMHKGYLIRCTNLACGNETATHTTLQEAITAWNAQ